MDSHAVLQSGRALLALAFVGPGVARLVDAWRNGGSPGSAAALAAVELGAGLGLMFGVQVRWLAAALALFLLVDAFVAHSFWHALPPEQRNQLLHFFKNLALAGAFVLLSARNE